MVLVDANVILDIFTNDPVWAESSARSLQNCLQEGLAINPIIYAELGAGFSSQEELEEALSGSLFQRLPLPYEAGFRAGQAFLEYRRCSGEKRSPLPDFYIGAHAEVERLQLLTRDTARYATYFPKIRLLVPEQ